MPTAYLWLCISTHVCMCTSAQLHSLRSAENLFPFGTVLFALRQLSHWKPSVQIFSWWRTHILCISRPQWMHSTILWGEGGNVILSIVGPCITRMLIPHTHTYGSYSMVSFIISLKADLFTTAAVLGSSTIVIVSPGISLKHFWQ